MMTYSQIINLVLYTFFLLVELGTAWRSKSIKSFSQKYTICFWLSAIFAIANFVLRLRYDGPTDLLINLFTLKVILSFSSNFLLCVYLCFRGIQLAAAFLKTFVKGEAFFFSQLSILVEKLQQRPVRAYMLIVFTCLMANAGAITAIIAIYKLQN